MIPDYCEALTAYRAFDVCENGLLVGQSMAEPWPPYQPFVARCGHIYGDGFKQHLQDGVFRGAPVWSCDCGIHALKSADAAEARVVEDRYGSWFSIGSHARPSGRAWGVVKLWGRLIEHRDGYRAEFAYPSALFSDSDVLATKIAALYGVPCLVRKLQEPARSKGVDSFWNGFNVQFFPMLGTTVLRSYSSVVRLADDVNDTPMVTLPKPLAVKPQIVGANRWQTRQYARQQLPPNVTIPDWRDILRELVFA